VRALVARDRQSFLGQAAQPDPIGQRQHRDQSASRHETRLAKRADDDENV
jgi:hypothetical protein